MRITMKKGRVRLRWVSQLVLPDRREWDEQLIEQCMYTHDAREVLQIRLSDRGQDDQIAWALEKSGIFSV
jgi:ribose 1,5-bisphosphokinase PhnN